MRPSEYDITNLESILQGQGDWFDAHLFRFLNNVLFKSDSEHLALLYTSFTDHCVALYRHNGWPEPEIIAKLIDSGVRVSWKI